MHDSGWLQGEKRHVKLECRRRLRPSGCQARVAASEAMTRLLEALEALGLSGQVDTSGRLVRVRGSDASCTCSRPPGGLLHLV